MANEFKLKNGIVIEGDNNPINRIITSGVDTALDTDLVTGSAISTYTTEQINNIEIQQYATSADLEVHTSDATIHFTEVSIDHANIQNVGTNSHAQIDSHIANTNNPHQVDKNDVGLGNVDNTSDVNKPISTATSAALGDKMQWYNVWENISYDINSVVRDGVWTMIANTTTTDRAAPQPYGDPLTTYPNDVSGFAESSQIAVIYSGTEYVFSESGWLRKVRIAVPQLTESTNYRIIMVEDPYGTPIQSVLDDPILIEDGWMDVAVGNKVVVAGAVIRIYIDALNGGSTSTFTGGWTYNGSGISPSTAGWTNVGSTELRFDKTDLDGTTRTTELLSVTTDSDILLSETSDATRYSDYRATGPSVDAGTYISIPVTLLDIGKAIRVGNPCFSEFNNGIDQNTKYYVDSDYWLTNQPTWTSASGYFAIDGVEQTVPNNGYSVDIEFQRASVSEDWDVFSYSGGVAGSGGGGSATSGIPEAPIDNTIYGRENAAWTNLDNTYLNTTSAYSLDNLLYADFYNYDSSALPSEVSGRLFYELGEDALILGTSNPYYKNTISQVQHFKCQNTEAVTITRGTVVDVHGIDPGATIGVTMHIADAEDANLPNENWLIGILTEDTAPGEYGMVSFFGALVMDTTGLTLGEAAYLSTSGTLSNDRPDYPGLSILLGQSLVTGDSNSGVFGIYFDKDDYDYSFDGCIVEKHETNIVVDGVTVYMDVSNLGNSARDLPVQLQGTTYLLNTTSGTGTAPAGSARIELIQGTSATPQDQLVYIDLTGSVPTLETTTSYPPQPFAMVYEVSIRDYTNVSTEGPEMNRRITSSKAHDGRGRISYFTERHAIESPKWYSGITPTASLDKTGDDIMNLSVIDGIAYQTHRQNFPALNVVDDGIYVANAENTPTISNYQKFNNLIDVCGYTSENVARDTTSRGHLVIFGAVNKETTECKLFVNLPNDLYAGNDSAAYHDPDSTASYVVPDELRFVSFLIAQIQYDINGPTVVDFLDPAGALDTTGQYVRNLLGNPIGISGGATGGGSVIPNLSQVLGVGNIAGAQIKSLTDATDAQDATAYGQLTSHTGDASIHFTQGSISIPASQISDFDTEVSNNSAVTANTAKVTNATHTGEVTGSTALTIAADAVTNSKMANMTQSTIKGRASGAGTGDPTDLTATQVRTIINVEDGAEVNPTLNVNAYIEGPAVNDYLFVYRNDTGGVITITDAIGMLDATGDIDVRLYHDVDFANTSPTPIGSATTITAVTETSINIATDPTIPSGSFVFVSITESTTPQNLAFSFTYTEA